MEEPKITHPNPVKTGQSQTQSKTKEAEIKFEPKSQLDEAIEQAERADGYLIMITRLNGDKLNHTYFTNNFRRGDIMPSLDEHAKNLEPEVGR